MLETEFPQKKPLGNAIAVLLPYRGRPLDDDHRRASAKLTRYNFIVISLYYPIAGALRVRSAAI